MQRRSRTMPFVIDGAHIQADRHVMTSGVIMAAAARDLVLDREEKAHTGEALRVTITVITHVLDILHRRLECGIEAFAWSVTAVTKCICRR
jgi:hypothetical protein